MGCGKQRPRALPKLVDLGLQRQALALVANGIHIHRALIGQMVKHIVRLNCRLAALLVPAVLACTASFVGLTGLSHVMQ